MLNVLFVAPRYHTNQVPIIDGLLKKGYNVNFLAMRKGVTESYNLLIPDILSPTFFVKAKYQFIKKKRGDVYAENWLIRNYKPKYIDVLKYLKSINPDIVILRERSRQSRIVYTCCKLLRIKKVVLYNQSPLYSDVLKWTFKDLLSKFVFPKVRYTPVKYVKKNRETYDKGKLYKKKHEYFLPFVQNVNHTFSEKKYFPNNVIRILSVGKYRDYKNHKILVEAVHKMEKIKNIHITIIGQVSNKEEENYYREIYEIVKKYNLKKFFTILTNIPFNEMDSLYEKHDIFILPSKNEVASISVLEAMSKGLCIISTDNNGTAFYVTEGNGGMIFDHSSATDLSSKLESLIDKPERIKKFGKNSLSYIIEYCNFDVFHDGLMQVFHDEF